MPDLDDTGLCRSATSGRSAMPHRAIAVRHVCTALVFGLLYLPFNRSTVSLWCAPAVFVTALITGMVNHHDLLASFDQIVGSLGLVVGHRSAACLTLWERVLRGTRRSAVINSGLLDLANSLVRNPFKPEMRLYRVREVLQTERDRRRADLVDQSLGIPSRMCVLAS